MSNILPSSGQSDTNCRRESIWRFQDARLKVPPGGKSKNPAPHNCADGRVISPYQVTVESDKNCRLWRFQNEPPHCLSWRLWIDLKISGGAPPGIKSKNPAPQDYVDWCLVSSYQVPAQSDDYCRLWIDLKISRGAPPQRLLGEFEKSDTKRLCVLTPIIILRSFSLIG